MGARTALFGMIALGVLVFLVVLALSLPANWVARYVDWRSDGVVLLGDARGNVWQGDAVLGFAANGVQRALPGRVSWTAHWVFPIGLAIELNDSEMLAAQVGLKVAPGDARIDPGDASLPLTLAVLAGAPLNTVRPNGVMHLHWDQLSWHEGVFAGTGLVDILGLWVEINPVRPLGDYRVTWQYAAQGLTWALATEHGPLQLEAKGSGVGNARFSGRASIAAGVPETTARRLWPLLEALGPRQGDSVQLNIGAY